MRILKIAVAAAACAAAVLVIARGIVPRYQCSAEKKRSELWMRGARDASLDQRMTVARAAIPRLMHCVETDPSDYEAMFLLGVAQMEAEQKEAAVRTFQAALAVNERPETYTRLGLLQLELGDAEEARRNLLRAAYFNLHLMEGALSPDLAWELSYAAQQRRKRLLKGRTPPTLR